MSSISNPLPGGGGGGGGETLDQTLILGDITGASSGIFFSDGDGANFASSSEMVFSSTVNPFGAKDLRLRRSASGILEIDGIGNPGKLIVDNVTAATLNTSEIHSPDGSNSLSIINGLIVARDPINGNDTNDLQNWSALQLGASALDVWLNDGGDGILQVGKTKGAIDGALHLTQIGIGTASPGSPLEISSIFSSMKQTRWSNNADSGAGIVIQRSRGAVVDEDTAIILNDKLSALNFRGFEGVSYLSAATITTHVDDIPGVGSVPGRMTFSTTASGDGSVTERMRIDSAGLIKITGTLNTTGAVTMDTTLAMVNALSSTPSNTVISINHPTNGYTILSAEENGSNRLDLISGNTPQLKMTQSNGNTTTLTAAGILSATVSDVELRPGSGKVLIGLAGDGILSLAALGIRAATTDVAPAGLIITGMDAVPDSTASNKTGGDLIISGGIGTKSVTIIDYTQVGDTITVTVNGSDTVLVENTDFNGETSNEVTATNLAAAIDAISGVSASAAGVAVNITPDVETYSLKLAETGTLATVENGVDGDTVVKGALDVSGLGTATSMKCSPGQASAPGITFGDDDSGIYGIAASNSLHFATGGFNRISIDGNWIALAHNLRANNDKQIAFGTSGASSILWDTSPTVSLLRFDLATPRILYFGDSANAASDPDLSARVDPTIVIGSATDPDTDNGEILQLSRGLISAGTLSSDQATTDLLVLGEDSIADSTATNKTGSDLILSGGLGTSFVTIIDFSQSLDTITITINGNATVLTEGTDFTAETSNSVTATNLAVEIDAISGVSASATGTVVNITADPSTYDLLLAETGVLATVTNGTDGTVIFPGAVTMNVTLGVTGSTTLANVIVSNLLTLNGGLSHSGWWKQNQGASGGIGFGSGHRIMWAATTTNTAIAGDTGLIRHAAGIVGASTDGTATDGTFAAAAFGARQETSDTAPAGLIITGMDAIPDSTATNKTGGDFILSAGLGTSFVTIIDYTQVGDTITVTINGNATALVENTDFNGETSNAVTATNLATAINAINGVSASATGAVVNITADPSTYDLLLTETGVLATVENGTDGEVKLGASGGGTTTLGTANFNEAVIMDSTLAVSSMGTATALVLGTGSNTTPAITMGEANSGFYGFGTGRMAVAADGVRTWLFAPTKSVSYFDLTLEGDANELILGLSGDTILGRASAGVFRMGATTNSSDGSLSLAALGQRQETSDTAPVDLVITGMDAVADSTATNKTGSDLILSGGLGTSFVTIIDFSQSLDTITITINGNATVLTEGTDFTAETSNSVTATNLAVAIDAISGVSASATGAVVNITADLSTYDLLLAETGVLATVTNGTDGQVLLQPGGGGTTPLPGVSLFEANMGFDSSQGGLLAFVAGGTRVFRIQSTNMTIEKLLIVQKGARLNDNQQIMFGESSDVFMQGELQPLTDGVATTVFSVTMGDSTRAGFRISYSIEVENVGGDEQVEFGEVFVAIVDTSSGVTATVTETSSTVQALSAGSLTSAWTAVTVDDGSIEIQCNADTSLTPTTLQIRWHVISCSDSARVLAPA